MDTSAYGCPKNALCQESDGAMLVAPLATVPTPTARAPLRITEGAVSTVRYLGIEVDDALAIAGQVDV